MIYDLFISYKSEDKEYALNIYKELHKIDSSLNIFMSETTLTKIGESHYADAIENAIKNSKNMVVVASNINFFTTKWINYEWRLFFHFQLNDNDGFYHNIITATKDRDYKSFPDYLQMCENVRLDDFERMYEYISNNKLSVNQNNKEQRKDNYLETALIKAGWGNSILFSVKQLSEYEESISDILESVTIIINRTEYDTPGNALFEAVEKNLLNNVSYNYIFLDSNIRGILKKIYFGHSEEARKNLKLEYSNQSFWVLGDYANATIYKYKNKPTDGYFAIKTELNNGLEKTIYIRLSEKIIDVIENKIEEYRDNDEIIEKKFED